MALVIAPPSVVDDPNLSTSVETPSASASAVDCVLDSQGFILPQLDLTTLTVRLSFVRQNVS